MWYNKSVKEKYCVCICTIGKFATTYNNEKNISVGQKSFVRSQPTHRVKRIKFKIKKKTQEEYRKVEKYFNYTFGLLLINLSNK